MTGEQYLQKFLSDTTSTINVSGTVSLGGAAITIGDINDINGTITALSGIYHTSTIPTSFPATSTLGASITALPGNTSTVNLMGSAGTINAVQATTPWTVSSTTVTTNTTSTMFNYTTAASTVLAADAGRNYAIIRNLTGTQCYIGFNSVPATSTLNASLFLNGNDSYEITNTNLFRGTINIIGQGSGTVSVCAW